MLALRPYLIEALYHWIIDSGLTPYLVVDINNPEIKAPQEYAFEGELTLDLSPDIIEKLDISQNGISFTAYFDDQEMDLFIPLASVIAIFAYENQEGLNFGAEDFIDSMNHLFEQEELRLKERKSTPKKPIFSLIKDQ